MSYVETHTVKAAKIAKRISRPVKAPEKNSHHRIPSAPAAIPATSKAGKGGAETATTTQNDRIGWVNWRATQSPNRVP